MKVRKIHKTARARFRATEGSIVLRQLQYLADFLGVLSRVMRTGRP